MPTQSPRRRSPLDGPRRPSINVILTSVVVVLALVVFGAILLFGGDDDNGTTAAAPSETLVPEDAHTLSEADPDGPQVTLVEFLDYQCSACAAYYRNITSKIEKDYAGRITFVPRNFPLDIHPLAPLAARAAEAAGKQDKFAEMYTKLYQNWTDWAVQGESLRSDPKEAARQFERYAREIGLDVAQFRADIEAADVSKKVQRDMADGEKLGVEATPTFFINGKRFEPSGETFADVERQLRAELDKALG
ncbi:MAG: thioredoxin domain-containing protein [Thermocrispum agreste]|uniref:Thioredoxin n=1 Tax=Thermocrispum agreste TaxID=37925 RepID=A0A2W4JH67_9PSEU|nr:MAG: thioredoxin [Thermocrispum agreste]